MVEQNARRCLEIADRGYVLDQGRNAHTGPGKALLGDPKVIELYLGTLAEDVEAERRGGQGRPQAGSRPSSRSTGRAAGLVGRRAAEPSYVAGGEGDEHAAHDHRADDREPGPMPTRAAIGPVSTRPIGRAMNEPIMSKE